MWDGNEVWLLARRRNAAIRISSYICRSIQRLLSVIDDRALVDHLARNLDRIPKSCGSVRLWRPLWGTTFGLASAALALVFGVALGNVVRGVPLDQSPATSFCLCGQIYLQAGEVGIIDWYTLLVGAGSFFALAVARQPVGGVEDWRESSGANTFIRREMLGGFGRDHIC